MRNEILYTKIKPREEDRFTPFINKKNWWKVILILGLVILAGPFFPTRYVSSSNLPRTSEEYWLKVILFLSMMTIIVVILIWTLLLKPFLNSKRGYNLSGQFEVIRKINNLGKRKLEVTPGSGHKIEVDRQFYNFIKVGDKVLIERRPLGDLIKVKKL